MSINISVKNNKYTVSDDHVKTKLHTFWGEKSSCGLVYASEYKPIISTK